MRPEPRCEPFRIEISARLDGEIDRAAELALDEHLAGCASCRAHEQELTRVRQLVRLQPVEEVPDLAPLILDLIKRDVPRLRSRDLWFLRGKIAAVTAAAAALLLLGTSLPLREAPSDAALADEIVAGIRAAATHLSAYRATFEIEERGWHEEVALRTLRAEVSFAAPESFSLHIKDLTTYPGPRWSNNDVDLIADANRWWIREPSTCPIAALPECADAQETGVEERTIVGRQPFDGTSSLPTDIVLPLETIASAAAFEVVGTGRVLGRSAHRVELPYRAAVPLVMSLEVGGSWRPFHPLDRVEVWIDEETWFPLRYEVRAGSSPDRALWAKRLSLPIESAGATLLSVRASRLSLSNEVDPGDFTPPRAGIVRRGGFTPRPFAAIEELFRDIPDRVAGLEPYRAGVTEDGALVLSYADGMTWLKVERRRASAGSAAPPLGFEPLELGDGRIAYYKPSEDSFKRRLLLFPRGLLYRFETNLSRGDLLDSARSIDVIPLAATRSQGPGPEYALPASSVFKVGFVERPGWLPTGYGSDPDFALRTGSSTFTAYYRGSEAEYGGFGIRIAQTRGIELLPPSSEELIAVRVGRYAGRWSVERSELEWIEGNIYRAVAVPSFDLTTALRIAGSLR